MIDGPRRTLKTLACLMLFGIITLARAHGAAPAKTDKKPDPRPPSRTARLRRHVARITREGESSLYLSGYAYHRRSSYSPELLEVLNEHAWGGGFGKTLRLADGGVASLAVTAFQDSLGEWEYNFGYIREWRTKVAPDRLVFGAGLSAFVTSRSDFFDGRPFPAAVPVVSAEHGSVAVIAALVPRLPGRAPSPGSAPEVYGDVVYLFSRIKLP